MCMSTHTHIAKLMNTLAQVQCRSGILTTSVVLLMLRYGEAQTGSLMIRSAGTAKAVRLMLHSGDRQLAKRVTQYPPRVTAEAVRLMLHSGEVTLSLHTAVTTNRIYMYMDQPDLLGVVLDCRDTALRTRIMATGWKCLAVIYPLDISTLTPMPKTAPSGLRLNITPRMRTTINCLIVSHGILQKGVLDPVWPGRDERISRK